MKARIALVQCEIEVASPQRNLRKMEKYVQEAHSKADIIVFPEACTVGPVMDREEFVDFKGQYRTHFQELARTHEIDIVPGSWLEEDKGGWYNTTYYIDSSGEIKGRYRKINLWHPERPYVTPGNEISVFDSQFGRIGLILCWDLIFPELFKRMAYRGVEIVICPSYWMAEDAGIGVNYEKKAEIISVNGLCIARAFETNIIVNYCNAAGEFSYQGEKGTLIGQTQVTVPFNGPLQIIRNNKENMIIQEIDTQILEDAENVYRIRRDLRKRIL